MRTRITRLLALPVSAFVVGLLLRLGVIVTFLALGAYENPETWENGTIATHIWKGEGFSASWGRELEPTSYQAPAYPYLLAGAWSLFGQTPRAHVCLAILQALLVSTMVFPLHTLTRRWFGSVPAMLAIWVCACSPMSLWFPARMHHTALVMGLHPWLVLGWLSLAGSMDRPVTEGRFVQRGLLAVGIGALTGLAGLAQPVLLGVYGLLSAVLFVRARHRTAQAAAVLAAGLVTLLILTPWTIRNYRVHGRLMLVKGGFGKEFWMGNNPHATGTGFAEDGQTEITMAYPPRVMSMRGNMSEMEVMDAFKAEAMEWARANRLDFAKLTAQKVLWFWTFTPERVSRNYGRATALVHNTHIAYWFSVLALTLVAACAHRLPREYVVVLGLYVAVYSVAYGLVHVGQPRYRGEMEFIFLPAMGAGAAVVLRRLLPQPNTLAAAPARQQAS